MIANKLVRKYKKKKKNLFKNKSLNWSNIIFDIMSPKILSWLIKSWAIQLDKVILKHNISKRIKINLTSIPIDNSTYDYNIYLNNDIPKNSNKIGNIT